MLRFYTDDAPTQLVQSLKYDAEQVDTDLSLRISTDERIKAVIKRKYSLPNRRSYILATRWIVESLKAVKFIGKEYFNVLSNLAAIEYLVGRESANARFL